MRKHTPGPWKDDYRGFADEYTILIRSSNNKLITFLEKSARSKANGRLIAAAPEMLDALKKIESCLNPEDNDVAAKAVRAAIAKAEGV